MFEESFKNVPRQIFGCSKEVLWVLQWRKGCFTGVLSGFQVYLKIIERVFEGSFNGVSRKTEGCSERPLKVIQGNLKEAQIVCQWIFKCVKGSLKKVSSEFQENFKTFKNVSLKFCFIILLLHGNHSSYPSRMKPCFKL